MTFRKIAYSCGYEKEKLGAIFCPNVLSTRLGWMTDTELDDIKGLIVSLGDIIEANKSSNNGFVSVSPIGLVGQVGWIEIWYLERDLARVATGRHPDYYYHPISRRKVDNILRLEVSSIIDRVLGVTTIKP
jgi:hypothetical protein